MTGRAVSIGRKRVLIQFEARTKDGVTATGRAVIDKQYLGDVEVGDKFVLVELGNGRTEGRAANSTVRGKVKARS